MVVSPIVVQLDLTDEFDFDALMFKSVGLAVQSDVHPASDRFAVKEEVVPFLPTVLVFYFGHLALILAIEDDVNVGVLSKIEAEQTLTIECHVRNELSKVIGVVVAF